MSRSTPSLRIARLAPVLLACLALAACGGAAESSPTPRPVAAAPSPTSTATTAATPSGAASPARSTAPTPGVTPSASPAPAPTAPPPTAAPSAPPPPTSDVFWTRAASAVDEAGRLRIRVIGPSPGELRYESDASATVIDGNVVFVCRDGKAYDGQSGWMEVPGNWTCGSAALAAGFRLTGQPLDAWASSLPPDEAIVESVVVADGLWRWEYRARNPFAGGAVRTTVLLDPAIGQIRSASRSDPTGDTTYGISYRESFPRIAVP